MLPRCNSFLRLLSWCCAKELASWVRQCDLASSVFPHKAYSVCILMLYSKRSTCCHYLYTGKDNMENVEHSEPVLTWWVPPHECYWLYSRRNTWEAAEVRNKNPPAGYNWKTPSAEASRHMYPAHGSFMGWKLAVNFYSAICAFYTFLYGIHSKSTLNRGKHYIKTGPQHTPWSRKNYS